MTMRFLLVAAFLISLSGCNYLLPPALLPAQDEDEDYGYRDLYSCVMQLGLCHHSTRANLVYYDNQANIELNAAVLTEVLFRSRYNTYRLDNASNSDTPALWVGYEDQTYLGLDIDSELILTIDDQEYSALKSDGELLEFVLFNRHEGLTRGEDSYINSLFASSNPYASYIEDKKATNYMNINPIEADLENGEFAMYTLDPTVADSVLSATSIELEVRGISGSFSTTIEGLPLERIKRMWRDNLPRYSGITL